MEKHITANIVGGPWEGLHQGEMLDNGNINGSPVLAMFFFSDEPEVNKCVRIIHPLTYEAIQAGNTSPDARHPAPHYEIIRFAIHPTEILFTAQYVGEKCRPNEERGTPIRKVDQE